MKAIVVFDVNGIEYEVIKEYFTGNVTLHLGNDGYYDFKYSAFKLMPEKREIDIHHKLKIWDKDCDMVYSCGYNTCIEDILGETE